MVVDEVGRGRVEHATVRRFLVRWAAVTDRRLRAAHPLRPGWDANRRRLFADQLQSDLPALSERQRMNVLAAFDALAERATVPAMRGLPALLVPGRVKLLVERLDVESILAGG